MAFTLVQAGTNLYSLNASGGVSSALTLPTGVTLSSQRIPRFARFKRYVVVVNTPSRPLSVGPDGTVRVLTPAPPGGAITLTNANGGHLTGTYVAKYTFRILDSHGNVISESDFSPESNEFTVTDDYLAASGVLTSSDDITDRQTYRNASNGEEFFPWYTLDGNVNTTFQDDTADDALGLVSAPSLGTAPDLTLIAEYGGRLWGVDRVNMDDLRWTEAGTMYAWAAANTLPIPHIGEDQYGIMALVARRNSLGVLRLKSVQSVSGATNAQIKPTTIKEEVGTRSPETVKVWNDAVYFLGEDGVYRWDDNGVTNISNDRVRTWFTSNDVFEPAMMARSFAMIDPQTGLYHLFLAAKGTFVINRWVVYDIKRDAWWGPHKTEAFSPSSAFLIRGADYTRRGAIGSREGFVSIEQKDKNDWGVVPIDFDVIGKEHDADEPDQEKVWGSLSVLGDKAKGTLSVVPHVGDPDNIEATEPMEHDMTLGREQLDRVGFGTRAQIEFKHKTLNEDVAIHGYELPWVIRGRR